MKKHILTERDVELIEFLAEHCECPLLLLAERFFSTNPYSGAANKNAAAACERRIRKLRQHGFVEVARLRDEKRGAVAVVRVAAHADRALGERASRRSIPPRERVHHMRTLEAIRVVERTMEKRGQRLVSFRVEAAIRAETQRGRKTTRGERFNAFPDAVCEVEVVDPNGRRTTKKVAIEYVTSKYTDKDIGEKRVSFSQHHDETLWFADKPRTVERVRRITGAACTLLR